MDVIAKAAIKNWADTIVSNLIGINAMMKNHPEDVCPCTFDDDDTYRKMFMFDNSVYEMAEALDLDVVVTRRNVYPLDPFPFRHSVFYNGIEFYEIRATDEKIRKEVF